MIQKPFLWSVTAACLIFSCNLFGQGASEETLTDLTERIMANVALFHDYASIIAEGSAPEKIRKKGIDHCLDLFAEDAIIEEQSKYSSRKKQWSPNAYLWAIFKRGEKAPVFMEFEVIDALNVDDLKEIKQDDGSTMYKGKIVFKQYYCKLKQGEKRMEPTDSRPNINCNYWDYTDKEVNVEITRQTHIDGQFWITRFTSIKVLRVYE